MPDPTRMVVSSSSLVFQLLIWMESMLSSVKSFEEWLLFDSLKTSRFKESVQLRDVSSLTVVNLHLLRLGSSAKMGTEDVYPPFPEDSDIDLTDFEMVLRVGEQIKGSGNVFFKKEDYVNAGSKYKKALRYLNKLHDSSEESDNDLNTSPKQLAPPPDLTPDQEKQLLQLELNCLLNSAACKLKAEALRICPRRLRRSIGHRS